MPYLITMPARRECDTTHPVGRRAFNPARIPPAPRRSIAFADVLVHGACRVRCTSACMLDRPFGVLGRLPPSCEQFVRYIYACSDRCLHKERCILCIDARVGLLIGTSAWNY